MTNWRWAEPWWLLLAIPLVIVWHLGVRRERRAAVCFSSSRLLMGLPQTWVQRTARWWPGVRLVGWLLLALAAARPQQGLHTFQLPTEGISLVMCLDRSGSMEALDFEWGGARINRLAVVKQVFRDFVVGTRDLAGRPHDHIGLVAFGGFAESKAPLTLDHDVLVQILESIEIPQPTYDAAGRILNERYLQEERATAIGDAVALSVDRLRNATTKSKVIILLSDGENTAGEIEPESAAAAAKAFGVRIYSIGIGSTGRVPFPAIDRGGQPTTVLQPVRLDERTLRQLASETGGQYFNARDSAALQQVYAAIDQLEKTRSAGTMYSEYAELFPWLLVPALASLLLETLATTTRWRTWP